VKNWKKLELSSGLKNVPIKGNLLSIENGQVSTSGRKYSDVDHARKCIILNLQSMRKSTKMGKSSHQSVIYKKWLRGHTLSEVHVGSNGRWGERQT